MKIQLFPTQPPVSQTSTEGNNNIKRTEQIHKKFTAVVPSQPAV